jgi:hypothetical protein
MAEVAQQPAVAHTQDQERIVFRGSQRNMAVGVGMIVAGGLAFTMGLTDVFFAEAMAWVFVIWGALFLFSDVLDVLKTWAVGPEALEIRSPGRWWSPNKMWGWGEISRLDIIVKRAEARMQDVEMQVYYTAPGDSALEREDRAYSPHLAQLIIERAQLKAAGKDNPTNFEELPEGKTSYIWNKSGRAPTAG